MSLLSLSNRRKQSMIAENSVLATLARTHFRLVSPPQFSRKEPRQPLLKNTPDEEKETVIKMWQVMLRYTGDIVGYGDGNEGSSQTYLGSVISRLSRQWGLTPSGIQDCDILINRQQIVMDNDLPLKVLPNKPKGGTIRRLRQTLSQHLFKNKNDSIYQSLPIEETLVTSLEQIQYVASCGILKPQLRDEIYCMICKHIINNPNKTSVTRCWMLLALIMGCFLPSNEIHNTISEFIKEAPPFYINLLRKLLINSAKNGTRHQPPSYKEMECYQQEKPIELQITLMDGTIQTIVIDATAKAHGVCTKLNDSLGLRKTFGYTLYIAMSDKVASLSSASDHVMDAISQCEQIHRAHGGTESSAPWRLFYRKELFSPWEDTAGDIMAISLTFAQIVRGIMIGEYTCQSDQELALLAARQYFIEYGSEISEDGLQGVLPSYIPADRRQDADRMKMWRRLVTKAHRRLFGNQSGREYAIDEVKLDVINYAKRNWAMAFSRYYDVIKLEGPQWDDVELRLAVNSTGVYVMAPNKRVLLEMSFPDIITIRGESNVKDELSTSMDVDDVVLFVLADGSFIKFESLDAVDIRLLVRDMISGLRMRSVWAVATADANGDVSVLEGDLVQLKTPIGDELLSKEVCLVTNTRTGRTGNVPINCLYVLPVTERPSNAVLKIFQAPRKRGSFHNYLEEGSLQNLSNTSSLRSQSNRATSKSVLDNQKTQAPSVERTAISGPEVVTDNRTKMAVISEQSKICHSPDISQLSPEQHQMTILNSVDCVSVL